MDFQDAARPIMDALFDHFCSARPCKSIDLLRWRLSSPLSTAHKRPKAAPRRPRLSSHYTASSQRFRSRRTGDSQTPRRRSDAWVGLHHPYCVIPLGKPPLPRQQDARAAGGTPGRRLARDSACRPAGEERGSACGPAQALMAGPTHGDGRPRPRAASGQASS
jgi:hypothetical protein